MQLPSQKLGLQGEKLAKKHLKAKGYKFILKNFHTRFGEIDLIFKDKDQMVFVEVKTRNSDSMGRPEESITPTKISHLKKAIDIFYVKNPKYPRFARIDAISVLGTKIKHIKNIS